MWQILCWSLLSKLIFSYLQQKRRYDVTKATRFWWPHMTPVGTNGLSWIFKIQFFLNFDGFRTKNGRKVHFGQVFSKKVDFGLPVNPLMPKGFSKIRGNSVSNVWVKMAIKWRKMLQMSWFKDQNVANFMLISFEQTVFFIYPTQKKLWRHLWHTVFVLLLGNAGP